MNLLDRLTQVFKDPTPRLSAEEMALATTSRSAPYVDQVWGGPQIELAPAVIPPAKLVGQEAAKQHPLAPAPIIDRTPIQIGSNLTGTYLSSAYRLCTQGWRYQFVDLLDELLEFDAHCRGVARQRIISVPCGRIQVFPAKLPPGDKDEDLAKTIADEFSQQVQNIPSLKQALGQLNWGVWYGVSASEILWDRSEGSWNIAGLSHIHSRRLNYPNPTSWDLSIYDQGLVGPGFAMGPTTRMFGMRVADYPGKFIVHTPALSGQYPTRDGEGRYVGIYMLLKRMVMRATATDFERVIKPWVIGYFNRELENGTDKALATPEDIAQLSKAIRTLGAGSLNSATLPDTVRVELLKAVAAMTATEFLSFLNREMSKALLGQAFTTEPGANGNLATSKMAAECTLKLCRYDAGCLSDTLERDLATPWMRLNFPSASRKLLPRISILVDELPAPDLFTAMAKDMASMDAPVDVDALSEVNGVKLVAKDDLEGRRSRMLTAKDGPNPADPNDPNAVEDGAEEDGAEPSSDKADEKPGDNAPPAKTTKQKTNDKARRGPKPKA